MWRRGKPLSPNNRKALEPYWASKKGQISKKRNGHMIICPVCGTEKYKNQRDLKRVKNSFCSRKCAYTFLNKGKTSEQKRIRKSKEYKLWRTAVFTRDNFQCIWGGKAHGSKLQADHIKPFSLFPELRFAIDNGRTLCIPCHESTDTYGGKTKRV